LSTTEISWPWAICSLTQPSWRAWSVTGRDAIEKMLRDNVIVYADGTPRTKHVTTNLAIEVDEEPGCRHPPQDDRLEHPRSRIESASDGSALRDPPTAPEGGAKLLAAPAC